MKMINTNGNSNSKSVGGGGEEEEEEGMILSSTFMNDKASLLESAFDAMDDRDKYDAVLTGLCSKILDQQQQVQVTASINDNDSTNDNVDTDAEQNVMNDTATKTIADDIASDATLTPTQLAMKTMKDPIRLLQEMNSSNVQASSRSLMALIDVSFLFFCFLYATCKKFTIFHIQKNANESLQVKHKTSHQTNFLLHFTLGYNHNQ